MMVSTRPFIEESKGLRGGGGELGWRAGAPPSPQVFRQEPGGWVGGRERRTGAPGVVWVTQSQAADVCPQDTQCLAGWGKGPHEHYYCTAQRLADA